MRTSAASLLALGMAGALWAAPPVWAQGVDDRLYTDVPAARVDSVFSDHDSERPPGCALGVYEAGEPVSAKGYGMASLEHGVPLSSRSVLDIASIAKQFTASAAILLDRREELSRNDPVRDYIREVAEYTGPVRASHPDLCS